MKIIVYTVPLCESCQALKDNLQKRGLDFEERDALQMFSVNEFACVKRDDDKLAEFLEAYVGFERQGRTVPVLIVDGQYVKVEKFLKEDKV